MILPPLLGAVIVIPVCALILHAAQLRIDALVASLPDWAALVSVLLSILLWLLVLLAGAWITVLVTSLVGGPFFSALAARIEAAETGTQPDAGQSLLAAVASTIGRELAKLGYHLPRLLGLLLLSLVPVVGVMASPLTFAFTAWLMALQFTDLSFENHGQAFSDTRRTLRARMLAAMGFGLPVALALSIPVVNLLLLPGVVAGGTLLAISVRGRAAPGRPVDGT